MNAKKIHLTLLVLILFSLSACFQLDSQRNRSSRSAQSGSATTLPSPTTTGGLSFPVASNFLQSGSNIVTTTLPLPATFTDSFYLRGSAIHDYLYVSTNRDHNYCLLTAFPFSSRYLLLKAQPQFFENFSAVTREYYFHIYSTETILNQTHCNDPEIHAKALALYPGFTAAYTIAEVCPTCTKTLKGKPIEIIDLDGNSVEQFSVNYLSLTLKGSEDDTGVYECEAAETCKASSYDCCLNSQCVMDRATRSSIDTTSTEFLQSQQDIGLNPEAIKKYPQFYYICPLDIYHTPTPVPTIDADQETVQRLQKLKELYDCTTPQKANNEMSVCTITYADAKDQVTSPTPTPFATGPDDRNFRSTYMGTDVSNTLNHSIVEIIYGGQTLYKNDQSYYTGYQIDNIGAVNSTNDTLTDSQRVTITRALPKSALHSDVKIKYRIDGSCRYVSTVLAQCDKYYIQGQNTLNENDHMTPANTFYLPHYADITKTITTTVDGYPTSKNQHWQLVTGAINGVKFNAYDDTTNLGMDIFENQVVKITYFVNLTNYNVMQKKKEALDTIDDICNCGGPKCALAPSYTTVDGVSTLTNYDCVYPTPIPVDSRLPQIFPMSAKSSPLRYYDALGLSYDNPIKVGTKTQEGSVFKYLDKVKLKPNNYESDSAGNLIDIGFNEIYGSYTFLTGASQPPKMVKVTSGRQYDIIANSGIYVSCQGCGSDYYSFVNKLFPENFSFRGGGYSPDPVQTNRKGRNLTGEGQYRSDDLLFGRACFVPATMIPWSHRKHSDLPAQRKNRLRAQHFMWANGYQRDWYGFDYGALIGSFDGVSWFAVGNQRRVKAKTNSLYLAFNGYFSDLTQNDSYSITVSEVTSVPNSGSDVATDGDSDGAQCQRYHYCESDKDCITQLGWDYSCQSVTGIKTIWPYFDVNGREVPNTERIFNLIDVLDGFSGPSKRCVYRGRGAACHADYQTVNDITSFDKTSAPGLHSCTPNSYCQDFVDINGTAVALFNRRSSRFAKGPGSQNQSSYVSQFGETDTFGLGARLIGRPYSYHGDEEVEINTRAQLSYNKVRAMCLPGRNPKATNFKIQHYTLPKDKDQGDRILNMGVTRNDVLSSSTNFLSSCGILDEDNNYYAMQSYTTQPLLTDSEIVRRAASQVTGTDLLKIFHRNYNNPLDPVEADILLDSAESYITKEGLQEHRCLRLAGSPCFSSFDCAPSSFITEKISNLSLDKIPLNEGELAFWQEGLVCAQKKDTTDADYKLTENRCCREVGNQLTIYTSTDGLTIDTESVPGVNIAISSSKRYTRIATAYNDMAKINFSALKTAPFDQCNTDAVGNSAAYNTNFCGKQTSGNYKLKYQFLTLDQIGKNTCCSGSWIRNFDLNEWGGGHTWSNNIKQNFSIDNFRCLAWTPVSAGNPNSFGCDDPEAPTCHARSLTNGEMDNYSRFFSSLELLGIPQVLIKTTMSDLGVPITDATRRLSCFINYDAPTTPVAGLPVPGTILTPSPLSPITVLNNLGLGFPEYSDSVTGYSYFSAADFGEGGLTDHGNFDPAMKRIFSENQFTCCLGAGETFAKEVTDQQCCTGIANPTDRRSCCLPDYTNLSVYLNRYVSSEANDLSETFFDAFTGAPLSPGFVQQVALDKNLCCSGKVATGVAIARLPIPGSTSESDDNTRRRFLYDGSDENKEFWDFGQRWNTDVYCVP